MSWKRDSLGYYEFVLPILRVTEKLGECAAKHYLDITEQDLNCCEKIILSGTALEDNVTPHQPDRFQWLKTMEKPVLGICSGMQTIGVVFGLKLCECLEIGMTQITTVSDNSLFSGEFKAYSLHNFTVEANDDFEVTARSQKCIQAIKHRCKEIHGVLFHPEVRNEELLNRFVCL